MAKSAVFGPGRKSGRQPTDAEMQAASQAAGTPGALPPRLRARKAPGRRTARSTNGGRPVARTTADQDVQNLRNTAW